MLTWINFFLECKTISVRRLQSRAGRLSNTFREKLAIAQSRRFAVTANGTWADCR